MGTTQLSNLEEWTERGHRNDGFRREAQRRRCQWALGRAHGTLVRGMPNRIHYCHQQPPHPHLCLGVRSLSLEEHHSLCSVHGTQCPLVWGPRMRLPGVRRIQWEGAHRKPWEEGHSWGMVGVHNLVGGHTQVLGTLQGKGMG